MHLLPVILHPTFSFLSVLGFGIVFQLGYIALAKRYQRYQRIYNLSPESHQNKDKTPTMGGLPLLLTVCLGAMGATAFSLEVAWCLGVFFVFSMIGFLDDFISQKGGRNKGLSPKQKLVLQGVASFAMVFLFHGYLHPLMLWQIVFYGVLMVGMSNATNLTDGLDGLLGGLSVFTLIGFYLLSDTLLPMISPFIVVVMMAVLAFLCVNLHPAKVFMGDTGSLGLGALFTAFAMLLDLPLVLLALGGVYVIETLSVMIQVFVYKRTKKRVFLMAPLHHHFELLGFSEEAVVVLFWGIGVFFLLVLVTL